jgi:uncharacterized protein
MLAPMPDLSAFLPDGVGPVAAGVVIVASFFTSALTAAFGLGGGLALLGVMGAVFPPAAVIPVHGLAQLGSNAGRFYLQRASVVWPMALWFALGSLIGTAVGARLYVEAPERVLQFIIGAFVLLTVWGPKPKGFSPGVKTWTLTGALSAILSMFVGATGPIAAAMVGAAKLDKLKTTATHAAAMSAQHLLKALAFGFVGFAYADWAILLIAIVAAGFAGTTFGTKALHAMPEERFRRGFTLILTFFGAYLIAEAVLGG